LGFSLLTLLEFLEFGMDSAFLLLVGLGLCKSPSGAKVESMPQSKDDVVKAERTADDFWTELMRQSESLSKCEERIQGNSITLKILAAKDSSLVAPPTDSKLLDTWKNFI
jgi:hypothetical protein